MKTRYFIMLISLCFTSCMFPAALGTTKHKLCTKEQCGVKGASCDSCYCSVKCGPRKIRPGDTPKYDEATGQCFCAPRDKLLYEKNGCDVKEARAGQAKRLN